MPSKVNSCTLFPHLNQAPHFYIHPIMHTFLSLAMASVATAHFTLNWPVNRGFDEDTMPNFPCGGFDKPSPNRTVISLDADTLPVDVTFHHSQTVISYLLALGTDPGSNFNITLGPTIATQGLGEYCLPNIALSSLNLTDGQNATLQVMTNGDTGGGLFAVSLCWSFSDLDHS